MGKSVGGLSQSASTIGLILSKYGDDINGDEKSWEAKELHGLIRDWTVEEVNDAIDELKEHRLVKTKTFLGCGPYEFSLVELTYSLFLHFKNDGLPYDPINDMKAVAAVIVSEKEIGGKELSDRCKISPLRINRAVDYLEDHDLINTSRYSGTAPFNFFSAGATRKTRQFVENNCR